MIFDYNRLKKKNPLQKDFYECQKYIEYCFFNGKTIDWDFLSGAYELPDWFIIQHENYLNWKNLTKYQDWTEEKIRSFQDLIEWECLDTCDYSLNFLREFKDRINIKNLEKYNRIINK